MAQTRHLGVMGKTVSYRQKGRDKLQKYESHSREKDCEKTPEDELMLSDRWAGYRRRKNSLSSKQSAITVIDLSSSDAKHTTKHRDLVPPNTEPSTERRRGTRKKKLFCTGDESFQDIDPVESTVTVTPSSVSRRLRTRRKHV